MSQNQESNLSLPSPFDRPRIKFVSTRLVARESTAAYAASSPDEAARLLHRLVGQQDREHFVALFLDARNMVTHAYVVSVGTLTQADAHPREVFKAALLANAASVILGHNHPSGEVTPSPDDLRVFARLRTAGELLGIVVLDALIVGPERRFYAGSTARVHDLPMV